MHPVLRSAVFIVGAYCLIAAVVYLCQRHLQYYPGNSRLQPPASYGVAEMKELKVKTDDGLELVAWFAPPKEKNGRIIVFYHGNAGDISDRVHKAKAFLAAGYGVYLCEYRRYGGNPGSISEAGLYQDARSALQWLETEGYKRTQWVIYGESIGSGPAVQMAMEFQPKWLILEGAFSSAQEVASAKYFWLPVSLLMKDKFDSISKIKNVYTSLLMLHGVEDDVINPKIAQKLFDAANEPKHLVMVKGGRHNDLYEHKAEELVLSWLKAKE